ncbi:MAG: hypothetical protein ACTSXQ_02110 [Alphaproteobacteria bacterium]
MLQKYQSSEKDPFHWRNLSDSNEKFEGRTISEVLEHYADSENFERFLLDLYKSPHLEQQKKLNDFREFLQNKKYTTEDNTVIQHGTTLHPDISRLVSKIDENYIPSKEIRKKSMAIQGALINKFSEENIEKEYGQKWDNMPTEKRVEVAADMKKEAFWQHQTHYPKSLAVLDEPTFFFNKESTSETKLASYAYNVGNDDPQQYDSHILKITKTGLNDSLSDIRDSIGHEMQHAQQGRLEEIYLENQLRQSKGKSTIPLGSLEQDARNFALSSHNGILQNKKEKSNKTPLKDFLELKYDQKDFFAYTPQNYKHFSFEDKELSDLTDTEYNIERRTDKQYKEQSSEKDAYLRSAIEDLTQFYGGYLEAPPIVKDTKKSLLARVTEWRPWKKEKALEKKLSNILEMPVSIEKSPPSLHITISENDTPFDRLRAYALSINMGLYLFGTKEAVLKREAHKTSSDDTKEYKTILTIDNPDLDKIKTVIDKRFSSSATYSASHLNFDLPFDAQDKRFSALIFPEDLSFNSKNTKENDLFYSFLKDIEKEDHVILRKYINGKVGFDFLKKETKINQEKLKIIQEKAVVLEYQDIHFTDENPNNVSEFESVVFDNYDPYDNFDENNHHNLDDIYDNPLSELSKSLNDDQDRGCHRGPDGKIIRGFDETKMPSFKRNKEN